MKLVDWHPEDLIDKRHAGTLSDAERERLDEHVAACAACRFELMVGEDLDADDDLLDDDDGGMRDLVLAVVGQEQVDGAPAQPQSTRRRRRIGPVVLVAAAMVITGSAAAMYRAASPPAVASVQPRLQEAMAVVERLAAPAVRQDAPEEAAEQTADPVAEQHESSHGTAASLFAAANSARRAGKRARALALYRQLQQRFAGSDEAKLSQATLGRMMLEDEDPQAALEAFDDYLETGKGGLSEEALVGRAQALQRLGKREEERAAWRALLGKYPKSIHASRARARLAELARDK